MTGNLTPRESGHTSTGSLVTRELDELLERGMHMTAVATPAGAPLTGPVDWKQVNRNVKRLQVRIVKAIAIRSIAASCQRALVAA